MSGARRIASHFQEEGSRIILELLNLIKEQIETRIEDALRPHDQTPQSNVRESTRGSQLEENESEVLEALWLLHSDMEQATRNQREETDRIEERLRRMQNTLDAMDRNIDSIAQRGRSVGVEQESRMTFRNESVESELESVLYRMEGLMLRLEERYPMARTVLHSPSTSNTLTDSPGASSALDSFRTPTEFVSRVTTGSQPTLEQREILGRLLLRAVAEGRDEVVLALLNAGADVNVSNGASTPLLEACSQGNAPMLYRLLESGADINAKTTIGESALHVAASSDCSGKCVSLLIEAGADVRCSNTTGVTPLHHAALVDSETSVRALLEAGASKSAEDNYGHTPLTFATVNSIKKLLDH